MCGRWYTVRVDGKLKRHVNGTDGFTFDANGRPYTPFCPGSESTSGQIANHTVTIEYPYLHRARNLRFACDGSPASGCWQVCPLSGCEEGCVAPDNHPRESVGSCTVVEFLENDDAAECVISDDDGSSTSVTVPVEVAWGGYGYNWRFK